MVKLWKKRLLKLNRDLRLKLEDKISLILNGNFDDLDIKPLSGKKGYFRCRSGNIRIIFSNINGKIEIDSIGYRGDVYK